MNAELFFVDHDDHHLNFSALMMENSLDEFHFNLSPDDKKSSVPTRYDISSHTDYNLTPREIDPFTGPSEEDISEPRTILRKQSVCSNLSNSSTKTNNKNETKNIPKNYGKAIVCCIHKQKEAAARMVAEQNLELEGLFEVLKSKQINSIADLRELWTNNPYSKVIRILSYNFMRKHSLPYIFKSRVKNHITHIKYREKFMEGLKNPNNFRNIKDY